MAGAQDRLKKILAVQARNGTALVFGTSLSTYY